MTTTQTEVPQPESPIAQVRNRLIQMRDTFVATLPSHIPVERFQRSVQMAVNLNPDLLTADRRSLFNAAVRAAQDGLLPDGREGALVIFKDKSGKKLVQWMPMVFGLIKKIRQSGEIDSIGARIVYAREIELGRFKFLIEEGQEKLYHEPIQYGPRGEKMFVYAYARFSKNGHVEYEPLHRDDVMKRKASSRSGNIWAQWEEEMWRKTAIRALAKRLPLSADIMRTVERDDHPPSEFDKLKAAAVAQLGGPEPETKIPEETVQSVDGPVLDDDEKYAQDYMENVLREVDRVPDKAELDALHSHIHESFHHLPMTDDLRAKLLTEFDQAIEATARKFQETENKLL